MKNTTLLTPNQIKFCRRWKRPLKLLTQRQYQIEANKTLLRWVGFLPAICFILATVLRTVNAAQEQTDEYFILPKNVMDKRTATRKREALENETTTRIQISKE